MLARLCAWSLARTIAGRVTVMDETISESGRVHLRWALCEGIGPIIFGRLLLHFGDAETALGLPAAQLQDVKGIGRGTADRVARGRESADIDAEIETAAEHGVRILCRDDDEFPKLLRHIPDVPIVLYVKGRLQPQDAVALAIVGTRRCSIYGGEQARRFGELLAGAGFTVVSGLARGIDAFAQHGALDSAGRSIGVLGNGLTEVYPAENRALADKLIENGALLSELPMRTAVRRESFDPRNRIIAGLGLGTLLVEAPLRSGAMITARYTTEYNREVFAIPGRLQEPAAQGTNALIRDAAAKLVTGLDDILAELGEVGLTMMQKGSETAERAGPGSAEDPTTNESADASGTPTTVRTSQSESPWKLSRIEARVFDLIGPDPILQDAVLSASSFPPGEVLAAFTALELKGLIKRLPGQLVVRGGRV